MTERDTGTGFEPIRYHQLTKHSPASVRGGTHRIDWMDQPEPFKDYLGLAPITLPERSANTGFPTSRAVTGQLGASRPLDLPELTRLVVLSAGVKSVRAQPGSAKPVYLRNYACAGALYPIELYLAVSGMQGLEDGVYHYSPLEDALRLLRAGDPRPYVMRAGGNRPSLGRAPVTVILTGIPWRTNWKYQARGYRHLYWDAGMIAANLLALSASGGHSSEVVLGFADAELDTIVGIDGHNEMSVCIIPIGFDEAGDGVNPATEAAPEIHHETGKLSFRQKEYNEVMEAHLLTGLRSSAEAQFWQQDPFPNNAPPPQDFAFTGIEKVIRKRGSKRAFTHDSMAQDDLEGIIASSTYSLACDWGQDLTQVGLVANAVDGVEPGAYAAVWGLQQIALGNLRDKAKFLCLEQKLGGDAAATLFLITDLEDATATLGARSYRAAQLNAGIVGGRMYLCAYGCGLGATGLTFYDDEVRSFFQTQAEPMLVVAVGK